MPPVNASSERLHGFDALRGALLLLGVLQHGSNPFNPVENFWPVIDSEKSYSIGGVAFVLHIFRMTAFFALAGFFARMVVNRRGVAGFAVDRFRRICLPLVIGWVAVIPLCLVIAGWTVPMNYNGEIPRGAYHPGWFDLNTLPLQHLWFLYILTLLCALVVLIKLALERIDRTGVISARFHGIARSILKSPAAMLVLAIPATLTVGLIPGWTSLKGMPTPEFGLFSVGRPMIVYGFAFLAGWAMHRHFDLHAMWMRWAFWSLAVALLLSLASLLLLAPYYQTGHLPGRLSSFVQAAVYVTACWAWTFALIGLSLRFLSGHSPARRYLADASYWIYLVHPPLLLLLGETLRTLDWPAWIKLLLAVGGTVAILLACYQLVVRYTFIGEALNGKRTRPARVQPARA